MKQLSNEAKVGGLIVVTAVLAIVFAWIIGIQSPFKETIEFYVTYNFAGGIEVGSPVRVSGIKVGKVESIEFFISPSQTTIKEPGSAEDTRTGDRDVIPLRLKLSIRKDAAKGVKKDSRFYVNLAGIIGERYIEVTPGSKGTKHIQENETVAGVDPPRIDQLISQSFDLAGKIKEVIEQNKADFARSIELLFKLSENLNKTLNWVDKSPVFKTDASKLIENLIAITSDVRSMSAKARSPEGEKTLKLLYDLLYRLEPLDQRAIRNFFQKEGLKVHFF
ncbi:MAG: hypothetical protein A2583_13150 [Bdellovibrionales bacterium RIFOXYD1_FULL_53_11]|nr:MAG: hypothetical protein A2583_13150 [Bdellovibrionales bacterium RIFOXYD1_FULL_53_11]